MSLTGAPLAAVIVLPILGFFAILAALHFKHEIRVWVLNRMGIPMFWISDRNFGVYTAFRVSTVRAIREIDGAVYVYFQGGCRKYVDIHDEDDYYEFVRTLRARGATCEVDENPFRKQRVKRLLGEIHEAAHVPKFIRSVYLKHIDSLNAEKAILGRIEKATDEELADFTCNRDHAEHRNF